MYCVNCGVKLADTEQKCPLCHTTVYHPDIRRPAVRPLYPGNKMPSPQLAKKAISGVLIFFFLLPMAITCAADLLANGRLDWFGYVAGALVLGYIVFALPMWFHRPNPVLLVPCAFAAAALYLLYIDLTTPGRWFLPLALPTTAGLALITCTVVTLVYYIGRGKLYIYGGATIAMGVLILITECLLVRTFDIPFVGWSIYPLVTLSLMGGALIYLGISSTAREVIARKLFF